MLLIIYVYPVDASLQRPLVQCPCRVLRSITSHDAQYQFDNDACPFRIARNATAGINLL